MSKGCSRLPVVDGRSGVLVVDDAELRIHIYKLEEKEAVEEFAADQGKSCSPHLYRYIADIPR
jgi:hypothetical protein